MTTKTHNNGEINKEFLSLVSEESKNQILSSIAVHYGTNTSKIEEEVFDDEAHHLLDYMIEPLRSSTMLKMSRTGHFFN